MTKASILVVEDDLDLRDALVETLELASFRVRAAQSGEEALHTLASMSVDMVVSDVNMDGIDGHELLQIIRSRFPLIPVVLITAYGSIGQSVSAMRSGAVDYLVKPFDPATLVNTVRKYVAVPVKSSASQPIAEAESSRQLLKLAQKVARSDATVLISGESGTGKEVIAKYIHEQSPRADRVFIAINCAAIPENMLEATLFGHEKGAFTGAYNSCQGKFEQADGGTILLDEISEMDIGLQAKILRVLQEREVERLGGRKTISLNVRVIATTNRDLKRCVGEGTFREDLYYRLSVFPLQWLPLRERREDIVPLARRLLESHAKKMSAGTCAFSPEAEMLLARHSWPGNVRELDNVIQRALIIQEDNLIKASSLTLDAEAGFARPSPAGSASVREYRVEEQDPNDGAAEADFGPLGSDLKQREYEIILDTLRQQGGRRKETAEVLGVSARTLRYKIARMRESGINVEAHLV